MEVTQPDGRKESKLLFFLYAPDSSPSKVKFNYAAGKDSVTKVLGMMHKEFQVCFRDQHIPYPLSIGK